MFEFSVNSELHLTDESDLINAYTWKYLQESKLFFPTELFLEKSLKHILSQPRKGEQCWQMYFISSWGLSGEKKKKRP